MKIRLKRSLPTYIHTDFVVDHPFIFFILTKSSSIIFVGRMTKTNSLSAEAIKEEL